MQEVKKILVDASALKEYEIALLENRGLTPQDAVTVASTLMSADLRGVDTHGIMRLATYLKRLECGAAARQGRPEIVQEGPCFAVIDGHNMLGPIPAQFAMDTAIEKAKEGVVGLTFVRNSQHYGLCAHYTMQALDHNMIGFSTSNTLALMAPTGGKKRMIGNNPISFAAPAADDLPFVLDIALSNVAGGKIMLADTNGQSIPLGWALDKNGVPTTDAHAGFRDGGLLLPVGGHKGYGMAVMLDILCGILSGGVTSAHVHGTEDFSTERNMGTCHMMAAINIDRIIGIKPFRDQMCEMLEAMKSCPLADGAEEILIPGELELRSAARRSLAGIPVSEAVLSGVEALGAAIGLAPLKL